MAMPKMDFERQFVVEIQVTEQVLVGAEKKAYVRRVRAKEVACFTTESKANILMEWLLRRLARPGGRLP
jgi:hypothetical protein